MVKQELQSTCDARKAVESREAVRIRADPQRVDVAEDDAAAELLGFEYSAQPTRLFEFVQILSASM